MRHALKPCSSQRGLAFLGRAVEDLRSSVANCEDHRAGRARRAAERRGLFAAQLAVAGLDRGLLLVGERLVLRRPRERRRALEHREVVGDLRQLGDGLHARRAGADDADALALELDALLGPEARLHDRARERVDARAVRAVRRREAAGRHDRRTAPGAAPRSRSRRATCWSSSS